MRVGVDSAPGKYLKVGRPLDAWTGIYLDGDGGGQRFERGEMPGQEHALHEHGDVAILRVGEQPPLDHRRERGVIPAQAHLTAGPRGHIERVHHEFPLAGFRLVQVGEDVKIKPIRTQTAAPP